MLAPRYFSARPIRFLATLAVLMTAMNLRAESVVLVMQNSEPKYLVSEDGISGLCGDFYRALRKRLEAENIKVVIPDNTFPIKRILRMLETGEADGYCGAGRNKDREALYVYSTQPIYSVSNVMLTHESNPDDPADFAELAHGGRLVGVLQGTSSAAFLKQQPGVRVDDSFHDLHKALEIVAREQYLSYFYYHDLGLNYLVAQSKLPLRVVPTRFRTTPQWFIYSTLTDEKLRRKLDQTISAMVTDGEAARLADRYLTPYKPGAVE